MKVIGLAAAIIHANHSVSKTAITIRLRDALYADAENISIITKAIVRIGMSSISTKGRTFRLTPTTVNTRIRMNLSDACKIQIARLSRCAPATEVINREREARTVAIAITIRRSGDNDR